MPTFRDTSEEDMFLEKRLKISTHNVAANMKIVQPLTAATKLCVYKL